jgi:hypothetical protein
MKKLLCLIGLHKWSLWKFIKTVNNYEDELHTSCINCGKRNVYIGITEVCMISGKKSPYTMKH